MYFRNRKSIPISSGDQLVKLISSGTKQTYTENVKERKILLTISITPWKVMSNVTLTASEGLITGRTFELVFARICSTKSLSPRAEVPEAK